MKSAIEKAVDKAGGQLALARKLGISHQAVQQWVYGKKVSYRRVLEVEKETGISRQELRPDLYPEETQGACHR